MRRVAVVGAGIGAEHAAGYAALPDRFELAAICDLDAARGQPLADQHGAAFTTNLSALLSDASIDMIDVCLPPHVHFRAASDALAAGKVVVCEKPLVPSLKEADALVARSEQAGRPVFPVFQYRYGLGSAQLQALMEAGLAGRCYAGTLETHWDRPASYYEVDWRGTWSGENGGAVLGHAIHIHDLLPSFLGPVRRVYAEAATRVNDIEVEDCAAIVLAMEDGALITSSVTLGAAGNLSRMRLMFEGFTVESDHAPYSLAAQGWTFTARSPTSQKQIDDILADVAAPRTGFAGFFEAVADALDGTGARAVTLADGRRSLEFVTAVYASARTGAPVRLPIGADHPMYGGWAP